MNNTQKSFLIRDCSSRVIDALPVKASAGERSLVIYHTVGAIKESFEQTTRRLLRLAELAHGQRDYDVLHEISAALQSVPFAPAQRAATYYQAILLKRQGELDAAAELLSPLTAPRAIQTLATIHEARGDFDSATRLNTEAMSAAHGVDPLTTANAGAQLAIIKSIGGDHHGALNDLQRLWPIVKHSHGFLYAQWCNAVAVELAAVGSLDEARRVIAPALASPVIDRFPEYRETAKELQQPARIAVVVVTPLRGSEASDVDEIISLTICRTIKGQPLPLEFAIIPNARILHARASPRGPPSLL